MTKASFDLIRACEQAIREGVPTDKHRDDKEFHFQRWIERRIREAGYRCPESGRNTYPDLPLEGLPVAFEVKGITVGSRELDFDCNSQLPTGRHDDSDVLYVFGRYGGESETPLVADVAIVHGDLLNPSPLELGKNKSIRLVGGYGDVLLRVRKMFVAYTPYKLLTNIRDNCTLVVPSSWEPPEGFKLVGEFSRVEAKKIIREYREDLRTHTLTPVTTTNPSAGKLHSFRAWRTEQGSIETVHLVDTPRVELSDVQE